MKQKKMKLFQSVISLLLCFSMLVGTTFAWFTDAVVTGLNTIAAGNLDVELYHSNAAVNNEQVDSSTNLFLDLQGDPILWEPGVVSYENLRVTNAGDLALAYQLSINTDGENYVLDDSGAQYGLSQILKVGVVENGITATDRAGVVASVETANWTTLADFLRSGSLLPEGAGESEKTWGVVIYWEPGDNDNYWNLNNGKTLSEGEVLTIDLGIKLIATQEQHESDAFGKDYDATAKTDFFPVFTGSGSVSTPIVPNDQNQVASEILMTAGQVSAIIPEGVQLADGTTELTMSVTEMDGSGANIVLGENEAIRSLDVHIEGVDSSNTVPMEITIKEAAPKGLNMGNYKLYHVENGSTVEMTLVDSTANFTEHNQFKYDPATGDIVLYMATFSEVAVVADTENKWNGDFDYSWYTNAVAPVDGETVTEYTIANADQLAAFGAIVGGMNGQTKDSFSGKTVKLVADVNLGDAEENNTDLIFYPIGYYNDTGSYEKVSGGSVTSNVSSFEGTFDGQGHTIKNFYQNTWEMFGDYNDGYSGTPNHYKDAMGLFGYVVGGRDSHGNPTGGIIKNLTVDNFSSDGEFTPTGVIAAYAVNATFENIAITNCNPRVYNTGNGGIIGIAGNSNDQGTIITLKNITVDNTNEISALWGSYDVACGGLVGMFRGNADGGNGKIHFENCHVAAQIDVYNDVCGNYQYYAYRYAGMIIGSIRHNTTNEEGKTIPNMTGISANGCTVNYGDWNDYYYCEYVKNGHPSYSGEDDYKFSRVPNSEIDTTNGKENATCIGHNHTEAEDNQAIYLPFHQLFTGYSWGVSSIGLEKYGGIVTNLDITEGDQNESVVKFETKFTGDFLYRVGNLNDIKIGSLFAAAPKLDENGEVLKNDDGDTIYWDINDPGVYVRIDKLYEDADVTCTFTADTDDWKNGTLKFMGTGVVDIVIQDYDYCTPTVLTLEVVDAENATSAVAGTGKNYALLNDVTYSSTYLYYKNSTVYGNGFTIDITGADHSDLKDSSDTNSNKSAYCNIWMVDSRFDNVQITGSVYPKVGMTADSDYGNAAIRTEGECFITNSYISNTRVPLRVQGNTTLVDTVVDGGRYANIELRSGKLTLDGVTTINTLRKGSDGTTDVIGFGIVIHSEAGNASIAVIGDGLKQYNWVGENKHKSTLSGDTYLSNAYKLIFNANNSDSIYFDYDNDRYVNTGILCLCADIDKDAVTGLDDRYHQIISGYDAWVLTYDNSKHTDWFNESVGKENGAFEPEQGSVIPDYSGNEAQTVEFTKGETYYFDTTVLTAKKFGKTLDISSVVMNGTTYNYGDKIAITEGGIYEIVYTVVDPYNYSADASSATTVKHTVSITVTAIAKDAEILNPKFTFIDQNGNKYESTTVKVGDKTYVMPNVTAADPTTNSMSSINIGSASISGTTVYFPIATGYTVRSGSNFNRYYPLFNGINITDYTIAGDTTGTTYTTSGNYTSLVGSSGTKFIIPENGKQTNCGDYVKTDGQSGNAAGNSDSGWQGAGYNTSYDGTYLKSGNTNASSGADSNGYERIVWVEYCFNAGNGDVYYYRIGYHCNEKAAQSGGCVTGDTLVTLADGSQKRIDALNGEEILLTWDFYKGEYTVAPVGAIINHGYENVNEVTLCFADGTEIKTLRGHGFFDVLENKFVILDEHNVEDYIGHEFVKVNANSNATTVLVDYRIETTSTEIWTIVTAVHFNCILNNLLTLSPTDYENSPAYLMPFEIGEGMKYDEAKMQADIEKYGQYTYEDFAEYCTYEQFQGFAFANWKVAVGKGYINFEDIVYLIKTYVNN